MKFYITILAGLYFIFLSCRTQTNDNAVGYMDKSNIPVIAAGTAKEKLVKGLGKKIDSLNITKIGIHQVSTIGEKTMPLYIIQFSDPETNQRLAKHVFLHEGKFYFYEDVEKEWKISLDESNETFYMSYYLIKGKTEDECLPNIAFMDGELFWITGTELVCAPDSPCKSEQILVM